MAFRILYFVFGMLSAFNGMWMLFAPQSWYIDLPAGVPDTGPYNGHFIRDLGLVFLMMSGGFIWASIKLHQSRPILFVITVFFVGHAVLHLLDLLTARLPHSHWTMDTPAVFLPALLLICLNFVPAKYLK